MSMPGETMSKVLDDCNNCSITPLDDNDLLQEILVRLPLKPPSLPRASLVCKRWYNILSHPQFHRRLRQHHGKPPLLGFFKMITGNDFTPILDSIPAKRFAAPKSSRPFDHWDFLDCRHGLAVLIHQVILINQLGREVVVWDPLTGHQRSLCFPSGLRSAERNPSNVWHAAVWCADAEGGHVHGDGFSRPFKVVLICSVHKHTFACLYDSRSGVWGNITSTPTTDNVTLLRSSILIENTVCWLLFGGDILAFDIERQTLGVIEKPADARHTDCYSFQLWQTCDDSCLGLAVMSKIGIQLWKRISALYDVEWVLQHETIQLEGLFPQEMHSDLEMVKMVGYDEDSNSIVLGTHTRDFMLELELMRLSSISKGRFWCDKIHIPYRNFYTPGRLLGSKLLDQKL